MKKPLPVMFFPALFLLSSSPAFSEEPGTTAAGETPADGETWTSRIGARAGLSWGTGRMGNASRSINTRIMDTLGIQAMPGYKVGDFMPGLSFEYHFSGQLTRPDAVGNTNLRGSGFLLGVGSTYRVNEQIRVHGGLDFLGTHKLSNATASGTTSTFKKPLGFRLGGGYQWSSDVPVSLEASFQLVSFKESDLGGSISDISSNKVSQWTAGVGVAYYY